MPKATRRRGLREEYRFSGFVPDARVHGVFGDPHGGGHHAHSTPKTTACACGVCGQWHRSYYDKRVRLIRDLSCGDKRVYLEVETRRVACRSCKAVKREKLEWLADNPLYSKRFAFCLLCRSAVPCIHDQRLGTHQHELPRVKDPLSHAHCDVL
jgi:hypothetical protein